MDLTKAQRVVFGTVPARLTHMVMAAFFLALHLFTITLTLYTDFRFALGLFFKSFSSTKSGSPIV